jgi:hypothetical protein
VTLNSFQDCRIRPLCHFSSSASSGFPDCGCKYRKLFSFQPNFSAVFSKKMLLFFHAVNAAYAQLFRRTIFQKKLTTGFKAVVAHSKTGSEKPAGSGRAFGYRFFHSVFIAFLLQYSFELSWV